MQKWLLVVGLVAGCATTAPTPQLASAGPFSLGALYPECDSVKPKRNHFATAALSALAVSGVTGTAAVIELGKADTRDAKIGLGITASLAGAAAFATGIPALVYQTRLNRCREIEATLEPR